MIESLLRSQIRRLAMSEQADEVLVVGEGGFAASCCFPRP